MFLLDYRYLQEKELGFVDNTIPYKRLGLSGKSVVSSKVRFCTRGKQRILVTRAQSSSFDCPNNTVEVECAHFGSVRSRLVELYNNCETMDPEKMREFSKLLQTICKDFEKLDRLYYELCKKYEETRQSNQQLVKQVRLFI